jgi:hypothetical protein
MGLSLPHIIVLIVVLFVVAFPIAKILGRLGYSKALVIVAFIPLVNWIALWILAYAQWPALSDRSETFR